MSPLVIFIFCCHLTYTTCHRGGPNRHLLAFNNIPPQTDESAKKTNNVVDTKDGEIVMDIKSKNGNKTQPEIHKSSSETPPKNESKIEHKSFKPTEMESGAFMRGVAVVVVLTALVLVYMAVKTYCGRRNRNPIMVSKYGVTTRRSDIEMTPLPLDEDEEDETVFEVHNTNR